jgi:uncharacterized damage-inducible protein DinB
MKTAHIAPHGVGQTLSAACPFLSLLPFQTHTSPHKGATYLRLHRPTAATRRRTAGLPISAPPQIAVTWSAEATVPDKNAVEPWLRGTLTDVPAVQRGVLHALELAREDLQRWCGNLTDEELNARPASDVAPVAFHIRHIARSVDRLLTYAECNALNAEQTTALRSEMESGATNAATFAELRAAVDRAAIRVRAFHASDLEQSRAVGTKKLPTTVAGLLVHVADHTQRHVGQAITTAKLVRERSSLR